MVVIFSQEFSSKIYYIKDVHTEAMQITREIFMEANKGGERFDPELKSIILLGIIQAIAQSYFLGILEKSPSEFAVGIMEEFLGRLSQ